MSGLDVSHIPKLGLHRAAVASETVLAPSYHGSVGQDGGVCAVSGLDMLHAPKLVLKGATVAGG